MSRFARNRRVFFIEEPVFEDSELYLRSSVCTNTGVRVNTPVLPHGLSQQQITDCQATLLTKMLAQNSITDYIAWYYTAMALEISSSLHPSLTVYDCMDELSAFAGAPAAMRRNEAALFYQADLVFTGGASLFESKRTRHQSVHLFPSSVDVAHFSRARSIKQGPNDQAHLPRPRLGYAGVIDERMDLDLLRHIALARLNWQLILLGPVVKIDPALLPRAANIHYLGMKPYQDLPSYFSGWDIGLLPFALNESTRFISPTKTPEYLAAGLRVVSAPIRDIVMPYGDLGLVQIASDADEFIRAADSLLAGPPDVNFLAQVDHFLSLSSWDTTWSNMNDLIEDKLALKHLQTRATRPLTKAARVASQGASDV